jgi:hypothetical protein
VLSGPCGSPLFREDNQQGDLRRLTKDNFEWPTDAELDVVQLPMLAKNLAKNFMNTFFAQRGSRLTLEESVRLSAQVRRSHFCFCFKTLLVVSTRANADVLPSVFRR